MLGSIGHNITGHTQRNSSIQSHYGYKKTDFIKLHLINWTKHEWFVAFLREVFSSFNILQSLLMTVQLMVDWVRFLKCWKRLQTSHPVEHQTNEFSNQMQTIHFPVHLIFSSNIREENLQFIFLSRYNQYIDTKRIKFTHKISQEKTTVYRKKW